MKLRKNISLVFLLLVSVFCGYLLGQIDFSSKKDKKSIEVVSDTSTVETKNEIENKVIERIVAISHKPHRVSVEKALFFIRDISAVEPKYLMSYYNELLSETTIKTSVNKVIHHMAVLLKKHNHITYVNEFINDSRLDPVVWRRALILVASDCSP